jgi:hypothetical protein
MRLRNMDVKENTRNKTDVVVWRTGEYRWSKQTIYWTPTGMGKRKASVM